LFELKIVLNFLI